MYSIGRTSIGAVLIATSAKGMIAIIVREAEDYGALVDDLRLRHPAARLRDGAGDKNEQRRLAAVLAFVEDPTKNLDLPLDIKGTLFQRKVWQEVLEIPFGQTTTFAAIAAAIGAPRAVRAVGNACSNNPLEFAIPCHRVLRSDGAWSGGSAWGDKRQCTIVTREVTRAHQGRDVDRLRTGKRLRAPAISRPACLPKRGAELDETIHRRRP